MILLMTLRYSSSKILNLVLICMSIVYVIVNVDMYVNG